METISKAYGYARVSSEKQKEKGTSIQSQIELIRKYAKNNGLILVKEFVDEAESATTDLRPQFQEMISLCRDNPQKINTILVWKLSRFARNRIDSVVYKKLLSKQGIRVVSISEPIQDTPEGRILEGMIELIDGYYSEILAKESMRGLIQTAKQGYHTGGRPPYGYRLKSVQVGNTIKKVWEKHPKQAEAVKIVYKMHSEGFTYDQIIEKLTEEGYQPRHKRKWGKSSISEILRKNCYSGTHYFNTRRGKELGKRVHIREFKPKSEWIPVKVPQIVDEEIFKTVKEKMGRRKFKAPRRNTEQILSGLLKCGKCNQPYVIGDYYRGKYPYYRCSTKMKKGTKACDNRNLRGDKIGQIILTESTEIIFSEENLGKYQELVDESVKDERKEIEALLVSLSKEQDEIAKKKAVYYKGIESGKLEMDLVAERLKELKAEEERVSKKKIDVEERFFEIPDTEQYSFTKKEYQALKNSLKALVDEATPQQKRIFLSKFINHITVHPDKLTIEYHPPTFRNKKSPGLVGQELFVNAVATPTRHLKNYEKLKLKIILRI